MKKFGGCIGRFFTGEWMFCWGCPNGNGVIFCRSVQITISLYLLGLWLRLLCNAGCPACRPIFLSGIRDLLNNGWHNGADTLPWLGAIFAAVWSSLFARFATDRNYLAGALNQIRSAQVSGPNSDDGERKKDAANFMHLWQAGFIADAYDLHLATSPLFGPFIYRLLTEYREQVGAQVSTHTHISEDDVTRLVKWLENRRLNKPPFAPESHQAATRGPETPAM